MYKRDKRIILIDTTFLFDQYSNRGIGRYGKEVLRRLLKIIAEDHNWEIHLLGFLDLHKNLIEMGMTQFSIEEIQERIAFHSIGEPNLSNLKNKKRWLKDYKPIIEDLDPDIYYAVHFERGLPSIPRINNNLSKNIKTVVTVHDVIPLINNKFSGKSYVHNFLKGRFYKSFWKGVQKADLILAPSDFSKNDLVKYGKINPAKVARIYLGVNEVFFKSEADLPTKEVEEEIFHTYSIHENDHIKKKYFFYDSGLEANKGIDNLLKIFSHFVKNENKDLPNYLVLVGGDMKKGVGAAITPKTKRGKWVLNYAKKINVINNLIATDRIPDNDLQTLLFNASAYLYLSNYEGFGFGPIQAMAAEIPAIASNSSCIPEITAGGALLINPFDSINSAKQITDFLTDEEKIKEYKEKGIKVAKMYNWDKTVDETWNAIQSLIITN